MDNFIVKDGIRTMNLTGELLAASSSERPDSVRWVEFYLYRASVSGDWVVSRVGKSVIFHTEDCRISKRNRLKPIDGFNLSNDHTPCPECNPDFADPEGVYPEEERSIAQICYSPQNVVEFLEKRKTEDGDEVVYLTNVARKLLEQASLVDDDIRSAYLEYYVS